MVFGIAEVQGFPSHSRLCLGYVAHQLTCVCTSTLCLQYGALNPGIRRIGLKSAQIYSLYIFALHTTLPHNSRVFKGMSQYRAVCSLLKHPYPHPASPFFYHAYGPLAFYAFNDYDRP